MRHNYKGRKLGSCPAHTKAMKRSLTQALLYNDRIKTIESRAKEIRPDVDRIITWAKKGDLHSRRLAIAKLGGDKELVREIFEKVEQGMFANRNGGYTRIMKLGPRKGDGAPMVIMELVTESVSSKGRKVNTGVSKRAQKSAPRKVESLKTEEIEEIIDETLQTEPEAAETPKEEVLEEAAEVLEEKEAAEEAKDEPLADEAAETVEAKEAEEVKEEQAKAEEAAAKDAEAAEADTADAKEEEAAK